MFVRLTFARFVPETTKEAVLIFLKEISPVVRHQKGNIAIRLLEPVEPSDDFISVTEWETEADADAYEASGTYKEMLALLDGHFARPPIRKNYNVDEAVIIWE